MTLHLLCSPFLPQNLLECIDNSQSRFEIENWLNHGAPVSPRAWLLACTDFSFFPPKLVDLRNLLIIPKSAQPFSSQKIKVFCMCCQCWATGHAGLSAAPAFGRGVESLDWGIWVQEGSRMTQGLSVPRWTHQLQGGQQVPSAWAWISASARAGSETLEWSHDLRLTLLICKMGVITVPPSWGYFEAQMNYYTWSTLNPAYFTAVICYTTGGIF